MQELLETQQIEEKQGKISRTVKAINHNLKNKKKDIRKPKRKYQKKKDLLTVPLDSYFIQLCRIQKLDNITYVCSDGVLRFIPSIGQISFNYLLQEAELIEENSKLNAVNIYYRKQNSIQVDSLDRIMSSINNIQGVYRLEIMDLLNEYSYLVNQRFQYDDNLLIANQYVELNEKFTDFQQKCALFLTQYQITNPNSLYFYSISRINLEYKMYETSQIGYSKAYLDLLGLDVNSIRQIYLRNKKIDLVKQQEDITKQALKGLSNITGKDSVLIYENYESLITTFDGFPLKIYQKKANLCNQVKPMMYQKHEFSLILIEIEVDFQSFQNLIEYRKRLSQSYTSKFDDFIRRESSYLFEDVEYSIQSQQFIDKFYSQNVQDLEIIKQQLINQKECSYKIIQN